MMKEINLKEFQTNIEHYFSKVGSGECFKIVDGTRSVLLVAHDCASNIDSSVEYLCNHNDGC